ncbi:KWG Leptospira repeat protein (plasmid) [Thalassoporum mexicanum PCC 7367]|nr:KWG Leptospira repeat protein [Pseudanabaena sp. PCC 7367]
MVLAKSQKQPKIITKKSQKSDYEIDGSRVMQNEEKNELFLVRGGNGNGFINNLGELVIVCDDRYLCDRPFSEGLAAVKLNSGKIGYLNKTGQLEIETEFDYPDEFESDFFLDFSNGLALISQKVRLPGGNTFEEIGFIDRTGQLVIDSTYYGMYPFSEGLAIVYINDPPEDLVGFIDTQGNVAIDIQFGFANDFSEGIAAVQVARGRHYRWGFIDKSGNFVVEPQYIDVGNFSEGLAPVRIKREGYDYANRSVFGFINKDGEMVISPQFVWAKSFSDGLAAVAVGNKFEHKWVYIDKSGDVVIEPSYDNFDIESIDSFSEGLASIAVNNSAGGINSSIGFIDKEGNWVIEPKFSYVEGFKGGLARVDMEGYYSDNQYDNFSGFISRDGEVMWKF